ncbi:MAG: YfhO family protein [Acidobacteria bacterium]|nr:YfhO family protein [Acidobacteriota bacterium]
MKRLGLWWVPLLLTLAPLFGRMPLARDIPGFFIPMRTLTSTRIASGEIPWLNDQNGCGEAWFADPETGVLYPPHWIYLVLPINWGMSFEVGFHLALLAFGIGMLAKRLGAGPGGRMVAEVVAWSAGPVLTMAGMTNNLDTLAWAPWMVLAALRKDRLTVPLVALASAMAWLAGEPEIWAVAAAVTILAAPRRTRAAAGIVLGIAIVAVQLVPFVFWILGGDRGFGATAPYLFGAVAPSGWLRTLAPGIPAYGEGAYFVQSLFLGAPVLLSIWLGVRKRWIWLVPAVGLAILASLPTIGGGSVYLFLTRALVRYPSRFAVMGLVVLLPFVGAGARRVLDGEGRIAGTLLGAGAVAAGVLSTGPAAMLTGVVTGGVLLLAVAVPGRRWLRTVALGLGVAACLGAGWPLLHISQWQAFRLGWPGVAGNGRVYTPPPPAGSIWWLIDPGHGSHLWPLGYTNLLAGVDLVRTYAPVTDARLAAHLKHADGGPTDTWWLDTLGARWVVLGSRFDVPGLEAVRVQKGLWLYRNRAALPEASLWAGAPTPGAVALQPAVITLARPRPEDLIVHLDSSIAGRVVLSETPVRGWHWTIDGRPVKPLPGPGILQSIPAGPGSHVLHGVYRPPGLVPAAVISLAALLLTCVLLIIRPRISPQQLQEAVGAAASR